MKIHIITDSAADIVEKNRENLTVVPMTITFGEAEYQDGVNLSHEEFYQKLGESAMLPVTSQISPFSFDEAIKKALKTSDKVIIITMSGKLSGTYQSACLAAQEYPGDVYPVDSENVTIAERILVEYALRLVKQGEDAASIASELDHIKKEIHLVAVLDTLEYLKKGGRISKVEAFAGGILSIKPLISIENGEVAVIGKARGSKQSNIALAENIRRIGAIDFTKPYYFGYSGLSDERVKKFIDSNPDIWQGAVEPLPIYRIGGTVGTHAGPGAIALAWIADKK